MASSGAPLASVRLQECGLAFARTDYLIGYSPSAVASGDFNGDHEPDLVVPDAHNEVAVLLNNGSGGFGSPSGFATGIGPTSVAVGDFNGDGNLDIVTANYTSTNVSVLLGNGHGSFGSAHNFAVGSEPQEVAVGDFNRDGRLDVITANAGASDVSLLSGNGQGGFAPAVNFPVGDTPVGITVGDLNGDGKLDLAVPNNSGSVSVLLGNGRGSFSPYIGYGSGYVPFSVGIGDFNLDGKPDLVVVNLGGDTVVLLGNGDGTFQNRVQSWLGNEPNTVVVADFNLDGKPDVAVSDSIGQVVVGLGDGTSQVDTDIHPFATGANPIWLSAADLNNDGRADIVTANGNATSISVLLNTCGGPTATPILPTNTPAPTDTPAPTSTPQPTVCPNPFVDIDNNIFFVAINTLYCRGDINGTDSTHYSPALTTTRAQFAKVVVLGFGLPLTTPQSGPTFTDVPVSYFAYTYIETGYAASILSGFDPAGCTAHNAQFPCYLPNIPITRGQLTKLVVGAAHYPLITPASGQSFTDVPPSNVFYVSIETAHSKGVINGYPDNTFRPNNPIRRDEMAQIVFKGVTTP